MNQLTQINHLESTMDNNRKIHNGLLFIPDISGYTDLVHNTDVITGRTITYELLSAIIDYNILGLNIAEIEGDAVFFYKYGAPPSTMAILDQYELMERIFNERLVEIEARYERKFPLSLKLIAHYGKMAEFNLVGFKKLYGEVVLETHRLLKNDIPSCSYVLITDELIDECTTPLKEELMAKGIRSNKLCKIYGGLRNICFTYFDYEHPKVLV